ncbi:hypothetical protein [Rhodonellum sp.]|nr:hypothetical protein [Rhodonellum sp.]MDO9552106.1 hypothetical protein [Rhodonellum sp.]
MFEFLEGKKQKPFIVSFSFKNSMLNVLEKNQIGNQNLFVVENLKDYNK